MVSYSPTDLPSDKMVSTNANLSYGKKTDPHKSLSIIIPENKAKKTGGRNSKVKSVHISESPDIIPLRSIQIKLTLKNSAEGTQGKELHGKELKAFYEKGVKKDEKSKAETTRLLATT